MLAWSIHHWSASLVVPVAGTGLHGGPSSTKNRRTEPSLPGDPWNLAIRPDQNSTWYLRVIFLRISAVFSWSMVKTSSSFAWSKAVSWRYVAVVAPATEPPP